MSSELLYTSAPKGLRQGSRGFCTVISSSGMPSNLATKLESLSGYRQMFAPESPEANQNPVAYSHMTVTVGGQKTSVLSRIAAYGTDYSGRTNKLAHHVVPDRSELTPAGPAWLMQQAGLMRTQWDGNCQTTAAGPTVAMGNLTATKCNAWEQLAGDAGWAGALAQAWSQRQSKPIWLVYRLEDQNKLLPLLSEAIALLPESERWKATFNTYATQLPPDVQCRVRCVVDGTQDARMAKARGTVITLGQSNGPAPTNDWSEIARGNQAPAPSPQPTPVQPAAGSGKTPPRKSPPTRAPKIPGLPPGKTHAQPALPDMPTAAEGTTPAHPVGSGAEPPAMRPPMTDGPQDYTHGSRGLEVIEPGESPVGTFNQKTKRSKAPLLAAIAVVLIALIGGGIFLGLKTGLVASLFPAPAENTEDGSETNEGKDKKDTKKKGKGANPDKNKKDNSKPTEKPTPPPLPKLTVAIKEKGNEPVEEGETLTVQVTRDNKESGDGKTITLTNDEKDARVSFDPPEIKFSAEEDSKEIKLTIKDDEEFNPAELTITAQFKEDDGKNKKAQAKLLVKDSDDLAIKLMDGESEATELSEGKRYQIKCPESPNGIARTISYKITPKEGIPAPAQYELKQKLASLDEKKSRLVLNETDEYRFADDFCKLSLVVSYKKNGKVLGKKEKELPVKDNDLITYGLRWKDATMTTVTKLVDESKPHIAANKDKGKQPQIIWETNEWPVPEVVAETSGLTGETIKLSSRGGQNFPVAIEQKTGQEHIIVQVIFKNREKDSKYDAHLFSNEESALAYINNPKAPSQPSPQQNSQKQLAFVNVDKMMGRSKAQNIIEFKAYQIIFDKKIKPFATSFKLKLTPHTDERTQFFSDNEAKLSVISDQLKSFQKQTDTPWSDNPLVEKYSSELERAIIGIQVIADKGKVAIAYELGINKKKETKIHEQLNKLHGTRIVLTKLMNHNATTLTSQFPDDKTEKARNVRALEGYGSQVTVGEGKDQKKNLQGKLAPSKLLVDLRKHFFETITDDLTWSNLQLKKNSFTWAAFERESKKHDPRMQSFTKYQLENRRSGESNEYKDATEKQMQIINRTLEAMQQAINEVEKSPPFDLKKTLVVEQDGEEILKIPLNFTLKIE